MMNTQVLTIGSKLLLLVSSAFAQEDVPERIEEPDSQQASQAPTPAAQPRLYPIGGEL